MSSRQSHLAGTVQTSNSVSRRPSSSKPPQGQEGDRLPVIRGAGQKIEEISPTLLSTQPEQDASPPPSPLLTEHVSLEGLSVAIPLPSSLSQESIEYSPRTPLSPRRSDASHSPRVRSCRIVSWRSAPQGQQPASAPLSRRPRSFSCETILAGSVQSPPPNEGSIRKNAHRKIKMVQIKDSPLLSTPDATPPSPSGLDNLSLDADSNTEVSRTVSPRSLLAIGPKDIIALKPEATKTIEKAWTHPNGKRVSPPIFRPHSKTPFIRTRSHTMSMKLRQKELDHIRRATPAIKPKRISRERQRSISVAQDIEGDLKAREDELQRALKESERMVQKHSVVKAELKLREELLHQEASHVRSKSFVLPSKPKPKPKADQASTRKSDPMTAEEKQEVQQRLQVKPFLSERQLIKVLHSRLKSERALNVDLETELALVKAMASNGDASAKAKPDNSRVESIVSIATSNLRETLANVKLHLALKETECKEKDTIIHTLRTANHQQANDIVRLERLLADAKARLLTSNPAAFSVPVVDPSDSATPSTTVTQNTEVDLPT